MRRNEDDEESESAEEVEEGDDGQKPVKKRSGSIASLNFGSPAKKTDDKQVNQVDMEGGAPNQENQPEEEEEEEEAEFTITHFYIDFRHAFLQANLQNILGKPKYQVM